MGNVANISTDAFPRQSADVGAMVQVAFGYQLERTVRGKIVRDDVEAPYRTIIALDDGRYVLGTECQYSVLEPAPRPAIKITVYPAKPQAPDVIVRYVDRGGMR